MVNWKGFGRKRPWYIQGTILEYALRDWGKPRNISAMTAGVPAKIRTWHLRNTSLDCYIMLYHPVAHRLFIPC